MKKNVLIMITVVLIVAGFFWWQWPDNLLVDSTKKTKVDQAKVEQSESAVVKSVDDSGDAFVANDALPSENVFDPGLEQDSFALDQRFAGDQAVNDQIQRVADIYLENSRYPVYSQPIHNPNDAREVEPFEQSEVKLPFPDDENDNDPIYLTAATDAFQYFSGDTIHIRLEIESSRLERQPNARAIISGAYGDLPGELVLAPLKNASHIFTTSFDTSQAAHELMSEEMLVKLFVSVNGRDLFTTVTFRFANPSAQLLGVGDVSVSGAELNIPLELNVFEAGYYFVSAVLEDMNTGRPLVQLQNESRLASGRSSIPLNAHISALRSMASEGPYLLRSINIFRGAETDEPFDSPAVTPTNQFEISGFPFEQYDDEEYVDPTAQERIEFLRQLGNSGNTTDG